MSVITEHAGTKPTALITGAAQGIGLAISKRLIQDGHPVIMTDRSSTIHEAGEALRALGPRVITAELDVSDTKQVLAIAELGGDLWSNLGILVNNAGISPKHQGQKKKSRGNGPRGMDTSHRYQPHGYLPGDAVVHTRTDCQSLGTNY
jgi:NAD(P)-dependent dehydrogenase (short-subunit alcohol dehydrogenase family)